MKMFSTEIVTVLFVVISDLVLCYPSQDNGLLEAVSRDKRQTSRKNNNKGKRQTTSSSVGTNSAADCDFGKGSSMSTCLWENIRGSNSTLSWSASRGEEAFWIGGPRKDKTDGNIDGGYTFFETSSLPEVKQNDDEDEINQVSAMLESPLLTSTGSQGHCVTFSYYINGLSADKLRVLLHPADLDRDPSLTPNFSQDVVLATLMDDTMGDWMTAHVMYTSRIEHTLILEAIPKSESSPVRRYRGFIAVDEVKFGGGSDCRGHCTFDSGLCNFINDKSSTGEANFEWIVGRGSNDPNTGPQRDHSSFSTNRVTGAYAFIDASYPRRPGDKAKLLSEEFPATDKSDSGPLCLRFWTHMFGNGVGSLNVYMRGSSSGDSKIWGLTGDAGNNWYMGQAPIASTEQFRIVFEGVVGRNKLGNIAIDDISIAPGVCPTAPQVAATGPGDCSFEDDECGWSNPERRDGVDELNWERTNSVDGNRFPLTDHTTGIESGFFMQLSRESIQRAGDRAFFVSREMEGSSRPRCMSFWYYMYEPIVDTAGPNLGKLAMWTRTINRDDRLVMTPVWRLHNGHGPSWRYGQAQVSTSTSFQVIVEGVWGNNRASGFIAVDDITFYDGTCDTLPGPGLIIKGECTFDRDACGWRNSSTAENFDWRMATMTKRPANLPDKTYGAPVGYAYFDIFNTGSRSNRVKMISPTISASDDKLCFSFWYAAFGAGDSTSLKIYKVELDSKDDMDEDDDRETDKDDRPALWELSAAELETARPEWGPGQVAVETKKSFRLVIEGKASNGGFAIDQLTFNPGDCPIRPEEASPKNSPRS